ncbi:MAG: HAD family phosphatase [Thermoflexales bacterium]|nr:HAD family phosphatase [Thermoflexales bacterium]
MAIKAVIFDFGGVLVRTFDWRARLGWDARLGLPEGSIYKIVFDSDVAIRASLGQASEDDIWRYAATELGLDDEQLAEFRRDFWSGDRVDGELAEFVHNLRPRCKTAILSNAWSGARQVFTEKYGLDQLVAEMIISAEEGLAKPDARIYRLAVERLGVRPEEAVFVDDVEANVEGARAVGMRGVRFETTAQTIAQVREYLEQDT